MEKATEARHRLERQYNGCADRKEQYRPNETKPYSNVSHLYKRHNNPTNGHTPSRMKSTHTRLTYTGTPPHSPGQQAGDHPVPAHTERHSPSKVWTQRQARRPPLAVSSQGHWHRCRSSGKQSVWGRGGRGLEEAVGGAGSIVVFFTRVYRDFGFVSIGLYCFLRLSSAGLIVDLIPGCGWAYSAFFV